MSCVNCKKKYGRESKSLKLLPICGHLMCQKCMFKGHNENQIKCPKCKKVSRIDFLGSISSSKNQLESRVEDEKPIICQKHAKEAQAFCIEDNNFTCVDCLILDDYKNKKVLKVDDAYKKYKESFDRGFVEVKPLAESIGKNLQFFNSQEEKLRSFKDDYSGKIESFFGNILKIVDAKKNEIFEKIEDKFKNSKREVEKRIAELSKAAELGLEFDKLRVMGKKEFLANYCKREKCLKDMKDIVKVTKPSKKNEVKDPFDGIVDISSVYDSISKMIAKEAKNLPDDYKKIKGEVKTISQTLNNIKHERKKRRVKAKTPKMSTRSKSPNFRTKNLALRRKEMKAQKQRDKTNKPSPVKSDIGDGKKKKRRRRKVKRSKSSMRGSSMKTKVNSQDAKGKLRRMREERKKSPMPSRKNKSEIKAIDVNNIKPEDNKTSVTERIYSNAEQTRREFEINLLTDQRISMLADSINSVGISSFKHSTLKNKLASKSPLEVSQRVLQFNTKVYDHYNKIPEANDMVTSKLVMMTNHMKDTYEKSRKSPWAKRKESNSHTIPSPSTESKLLSSKMSPSYLKNFSKTYSSKDNKLGTNLSNLITVKNFGQTLTTNSNDYVFDSIVNPISKTMSSPFKRKPPVPEKSVNSPHNVSKNDYSRNFNNCSAENMLLSKNYDDEGDIVKIHNSGQSINFSSRMKSTPDKEFNVFKKSEFGNKKNSLGNGGVNFLQKIDISMSGGSMLFQNSIKPKNFLNFGKNTGDIYCIGGVGTTSGMMVERMKDGSDEWEIIGSEEKSRCKFGCVFLSDSKILVFGGKSGEGRLKDSSIFDLEKGEWIKCSFELSDTISGFGCCMVGGNLYIAGGNNGDSISDSLEEYDLVNGTSKKLSSMNHARDEVCLLFLDQSLYAVGGGGEKGENLKSVERYDFLNDSWEVCSYLRIPRRAHAGVSVGGNLYVMGGFDGERYLCSVEKYNPLEKTWEQVKFMHESRCTHSVVAAVDNKRIIVTGGFNGKSLDTVEEYNIDTDTWTKLPKLKLARFMHYSFCYKKTDC